MKIRNQSFNKICSEYGLKPQDYDKYDFNSLGSDTTPEILSTFLEQEYGLCKKPIIQEFKEYELKQKHTIKQDEAMLLPQHYGTILITGQRGSGKTALGFYLLEQAHKQGRNIAIFGMPINKKHLIPSYIQLIQDIQYLPNNSVILLDECALNFYNRDFSKKNNKIINKLITLARHKNQILIFITQHTRKLDIGVVMDSDILLFKKPSLLYESFERREIKPLIREATERLNNLPQDYLFYVSDSEKTILKNPLASFWTQELSKAFEQYSVMQQNKSVGIITFKNSDDYNKYVCRTLNV